MIRHCLEMVQFAPDFRQAEPEFCCEIIESCRLELRSAVRYTPQGGGQRFSFAAQDVGPCAYRLAEYRITAATSNAQR